MCGIAGELRFDGQPASRDAVAAMVDALAPRGPDGHGLVAAGRTALGHRRLAVIDPTPRSAQPMVDSELGLSIVYNGALYEYRRVRQRLVALGYRFTSDGDTEVVLKAFHAWGPECVLQLEGMFAFAITDAEGRCFIARDRMGIKPLYWSANGGRFRFASTLPALLAAGGVDTRLDPVALQQFCTLHGVVVAPHTVLQGVRKLPPATWMLIEADGARRERVYWTMERRPTPGVSPQAWTGRLREALITAVRRRCVADTPVGVLLSGGLDSSLIVAMLARQGSTDLATFSIGFDAAGGETGDEFQWSDEVVRRFGTRHTKIRVTSSETLNALDDAVAAMSEPMVSHDCVAFHLLGRAVAGSRKVVQSGQGADELLGGYHWYERLLHARGPEDYAAAFCDRDFAGYAALVESPWAARDVVRPFIADHFARAGAPSPIDATLRIDATVMLPGDPAARLDSMMMASGIEARVPFLDEAVVDVARQIPAALSVRGGKAILKSVAREFLPATLVDRPKGYFPVPALRWITGPFRERVRAWLTSRRARERGLFRPAAVTRLLEAPRETLTPLGGSTLWQLAVLEGWLVHHGL